MFSSEQWRDVSLNSGTIPAGVWCRAAVETSGYQVEMRPSAGDRRGQRQQVGVRSQLAVSGLGNPQLWDGVGLSWARAQLCAPSEHGYLCPEVMSQCSGLVLSSVTKLEMQYGREEREN